MERERDKPNEVGVINKLARSKLDRLNDDDYDYDDDGRIMRTERRP